MNFGVAEPRVEVEVQAANFDDARDARVGVATSDE